MNIVERTIGTKIHRGLVALVVTICRCNRRKQKRMSFCPACYHRLPLEMKQRLFLRAGQGYEEAYDAAVEYLSEGRKPSELRGSIG
jgi:hypothetical protein